MFVATKRKRAGGRAGFTLLELLIALSVFGITMGALSVLQFSSIALSRSNQDLSAAMDAAQSVLEELREEGDFSDIFVRWNGNPGDDPDASAPGNAFDVRGLEPAPDDPDGRVGEVIFPGDGLLLIEDGTDRALGTPRDLNLDGDIDSADHASDYRVLPVLVRVRWLGSRGTQQIEIASTLVMR